jgi:hypothetical protein
MPAIIDRLIISAKMMRCVAFTVSSFEFNIKKSPAPENRGLMARLISFTPFLRGGFFFVRAGVLTVTASGTVPEFHRLALQLSFRFSESTLTTTYNLNYLYRKINLSLLYFFLRIF